VSPRATRGGIATSSVSSTVSGVAHVAAFGGGAAEQGASAPPPLSLPPSERGEPEGGEVSGAARGRRCSAAGECRRIRSSP
jgi:hypothetical protein